jgi:hypothetical protein
MGCHVGLDCLMGQSGLGVACRNCAIACYGLPDVGRNKSLWTQLRHGVPRGLGLFDRAIEFGRGLP